MAEKERNFPTKDSKGNNITPHITEPMVQVKEPKDGPLKKAAKSFFSEDIDHVTDSIVDEFIAPRAKSFGEDLKKKTKEFMFDSITDFFGKIFFGNKSSGVRSSYNYNRSGTTYTSYSKYSNTGSEFSDDYYWYNGQYVKNDKPAERVPHDIVREYPITDDAGKPDAGAAQRVLDKLRYIIRTEKFAYVGDYYTAIGAATDSLDYEFIWTGNMLDNCKPSYTKRGYVLNLPKPIPKP